MANNSTDFDLLLKLITNEEKFVLATHVQPDGDAIGSMLGFGLLLKRLGKEVFASWGEPILIPPQYSFLPGIELIQDPSDCPDPVTNFLALDCATLDRLGSFAESAEKAKNLVSIDHHAEKGRFAAINIVDKNASSTAELIMRISKALGQKLTKDIATCLYVGLVTDTGKFQYSNTSVETFKVAEELLEYGVSPNRIFQKLYENVGFGYLRLLGLALSRITLVEDCGFIYTWILQSDLVETGAKLSESENLIDLLRSVEGIKVAAVFKELEDGRFNASLRSRNAFKVNKLAENFGGGGHPNAAGYRGTNNLQETLENLLKVLRESK